MRGGGGKKVKLFGHTLALTPSRMFFSLFLWQNWSILKFAVTCLGFYLCNFKWITLVLTLKAPSPKYLMFHRQGKKPCCLDIKVYQPCNPVLVPHGQSDPVVPFYEPLPDCVFCLVDDIRWQYYFPRMNRACCFV